MMDMDLTLGDGQNSKSEMSKKGNQTRGDQTPLTTLLHNMKIAPPII